MSKENNAIIHVYVDGGESGIRYWPMVPRVGETVEVRQRKPTGEVFTASVIVRDVVWAFGVPDSGDGGVVRVNVFAQGYKPDTVKSNTDKD